MTFKGAVRFGVLIAFAAVSAGIAWADGSSLPDPKVEITAPEDEPVCSPGENSAFCFSGDTITIDGTIDSSAVFTYDGATTLETLFIDVTPTIPHDFYSCNIVAITNAAFNSGPCLTSSDSTPTELIFAATCNGVGCDGLSSFEGVGADVDMPEPAEADLLLFGVGGVFLLGFGGRKGWKVIGASQVS
ncbi:MAG: hypothetical protein ABSB66_05195 [Candidatus Acidiferrales bacterium]|jgi:hypothetical protein